MEGSFNIDFAHPGRSLRPVKKSALELLWHRLVTRQIDAKLGALIIVLMILISGTTFYVLNIYIPGAARITELIKENKKLNIKSRALKSRYDSQESKSIKLIDEVNKIKKLRKKYFFWSDKLIEIKRQLVKSLWLYSFKITTIEEKTADKVDKGKKKKGKKKGKKRKKVFEFSDKFVGSPTFKVIIKGTTFSAPKKQPVKLISRFIDGLMESPAWKKYFKLDDWRIITENSDSDVINFELSLVSLP